MAKMPEGSQKQIGERRPSQVEMFLHLRGEIDKGVRSLDASKGDALDLDDLLQQDNERYEEQVIP